MKRILTAFILIPLALLVVFLWPQTPWLFTLAVAFVAALSAWEFLGLAETSGAHPPRIAVLVAILGLFACNLIWDQKDHTAAIVVVLSLALLVYCTFFRPVDSMLADASTAIFCFFYIGTTLITLTSLREEPNGPSLVAFLLCVVWAGDTGALYVGRAWGRHKMASALSPHKTWEGALGSLAGSLLATGALLGLAHLFVNGLNKYWLSYSDDHGTGWSSRWW
jgi:phosphatidate cytidylyltransferase